MANKVLDLSDKLQEKRRKSQSQSYHDRIEKIHEFVKCASCDLRCAMCGYYLDETHSLVPSTPSSPDFNFCASCRAEFEDFMAVAIGKERSSIFWHNEEWVKLWGVWLDYKKAIHEFRDSQEFRQMAETPEN